MSLFLGLDSSTQGLKIAVVDEKLSVKLSTAVNFDTDLPKYKTENGVYRNGLEVTAPSLMFAAALDLGLQRLQEQKCDFENVRIRRFYSCKRGISFFERL